MGQLAFNSKVARLQDFAVQENGEQHSQNIQQFSYKQGENV